MPSQQLRGEDVLMRGQVGGNSTSQYSSHVLHKPLRVIPILTHDAHLGKGSIVMPGGTSGSRHIAWWIRRKHASHSKIANGMGGGSMAHVICVVHHNLTSVS